LGLPWPEEGREELGRRAQVWSGRPALRTVKPENWHVTLRFLGDLPEDRVPVLVALMETWSRRRGPLTFVDRGWGCFGSRIAPRVVTLALEALPDGRRAVEALHKALDAAAFTGDGKPWKPHVTLAYGTGADPGPWPEEILGGRPPLLFPRVSLYDSQLGPTGSTYRELATALL